MSLDYWRNEDKTCTLSLIDTEEGLSKEYYLLGEWDNDVTQCRLTKKDMASLRDALNRELMFAYNN